VRRIVIIIALVAVVGFAGYMLLRPRSKGRTSRSTPSDSGALAKPSRKGGRTAGKLKARTKKELAEEKKKLKTEERKRRKALRRQERERKRRLRAARKRRGTRGSRRRKGRLYVVSAIVSLGDDSYALIDGRRVGIGDVIMGRKIVSIQPDRVVVDAFGKTSVVRVGESILPTSYSLDRRRSR